MFHSNTAALDAAVHAAWREHRSAGDPHASESAPLIVPGPGRDGTVILGPPRTLAGQRSFGALVPPGVALEPDDRTGFRLVVWQVETHRTAINLWREPPARRARLTLHEAFACVTLWACDAAQTRLAVDWLKSRVEHSLQSWREILAAPDEPSDPCLARRAETELLAALEEATALWGRDWAGTALVSGRPIVPSPRSAQ